MLKQRDTYKKDIETREKPKSKEKIELKYASFQQKLSFLHKMMTYDDFSKKCHLVFQFFCFLEIF